MGDVVEFRAKKLSGFIPNDLGEALPGFQWPSDVIRPHAILDPDKIQAAIDTACSQINPDSGDCA